MNTVAANVIKFIVIAVCLLFIVFVIWKLYRDNIDVQDSISWPPVIGKCPDYWVYDSDGNCHGEDGKVIVPLTGEITQEQLIAKCEEVKNAGIPWDGIDSLC